MQVASVRDKTTFSCPLCLALARSMQKDGENSERVVWMLLLSSLPNLAKRDNALQLSCVVVHDSRAFLRPSWAVHCDPRKAPAEPNGLRRIFRALHSQNSSFSPN